MQLSTNQLDAQLKKSLPACIVLAGEEPLLIQEMRDKIFLKAREQGFAERQLFFLDNLFKIESLHAATQNNSLFSEKKLIDIRNPTEKMNAELAHFLQDFATSPVMDCCIVVSTGKLSTAQQKTNWFDTIKKHAVYAPIWPIPARELPQWIINRAKQFNLMIPLDLANLIAYACEGHLTAAHQLIEKLNLLYPNTALTKQQVMAVLSDQARFGIVDLINAIASHQVKKTIRILKHLQQSAEEPVLVLWHLTRLAREKNNKPAIQKAARTDQVMKGATTGDTWECLLQFSLLLCGVSMEYDT